MIQYRQNAQKFACADPAHRGTILFGRSFCYVKVSHMHFSIESEREEDGRWLAEVADLPGVLAYGSTRDEALAHAEILALRVLADRLEHREGEPQAISISIAAA